MGRFIRMNAEMVVLFYVAGIAGGLIVKACGADEDTAMGVANMVGGVAAYLRFIR